MYAGTIGGLLNLLFDDVTLKYTNICGIVDTSCDGVTYTTIFTNNYDIGICDEFKVIKTFINNFGKINTTPLQYPLCVFISSDNTTNVFIASQSNIENYITSIECESATIDEVKLIRDTAGNDFLCIYAKRD